MRTYFKNRGHFCNYCRKILSNKLPTYHHHTINLAIWCAWDRPESRNALLQDLIGVAYNPLAESPTRDFNQKLKVIAKKYLSDVSDKRCQKKGGVQ